MAVLFAFSLVLAGCSQAATEVHPTVTIGTENSTLKYAEAMVQAFNRSPSSDEQLKVILLSSDVGSSGDSQTAVDAVLSVSPRADMDWTTSLGWAEIEAVVHSGNPVRNLASSDVRNILLGIDRTWMDFGGQDQPISVFVPDPATDIGRALQAAAVPEGRYFGGVELLPASWGVVDAVAAAANGLGFVFCPEGASGLTILSIDGVKPSPGKMVDGSYPYRIPIFLSAQRPVPGEISDFAAWAQTETGQTVVSDICQAG